MPEKKMLQVPEDKVREAMKTCPEGKKILETIFAGQLGPEFPEMEPGMIYVNFDKSFWVASPEDSTRKKFMLVSLPYEQFGVIWSSPKIPSDLYEDGFRTFTGRILLDVMGGKVKEVRKVGIVNGMVFNE